MKIISVEISADELLSEVGIFPGVIYEAELARKLREAGIPVKGIFKGVERGTLIRLDDPMDWSKYKYVWVDKEGSTP